MDINDYKTMKNYSSIGNCILLCFSPRQTRSTRNEYDIDSLGRATISLNISDDVQELSFRVIHIIFYI